jgi:hypothetical protein
MFSIPANTSERCRDERDHAFVPPATAPVTARKLAALLRCLTDQSPHTAFIDNARSRSPVSHGRELRRPAKARTYNPTKTHRRDKCAAVLNVFRTTQASGARSATESLASSGTTPGEPLSVQGGAPIDSRFVERMIADFCLKFRPPNCGCGKNSAAGSPFWSKDDPPEKVERNRDNPDGRNHLCAPPPNVLHPSDTVFCFALGGAS